MDDKQAYVEDYNSVLSEVIPVPRRQAGTKRQSGLSQCMNMSYDNVQSDSGYSSHSAEQSRQGKELEDDRSTPTDHHTPPPVPAHHRRQISQLNSVMNQSPQMPTPTNSRPGSSKNLSRSNSPAVRDDRDRRPPPPPQQQQQQRPESPTDSDDESDCDCANCRGLDQKPTPASPLSQPWNLNYPPFNGPPPGPPGPPGPPMLSGSFPKNYGQPGFPPMGAPYGRYAETSPPYGRPGQQQLLPPVSFDEEAIDDEQHDLPPRRPDSTSRGKPRPMSYSGSTSQNPVSSHGSWGAYGSGYPTPGGPLPPGSQPPPAPGYPPSSYRDPTMGGAAGSPQGSSALTYGYAPPGPSPYPGYPPPPQGYPPYNGAEMVPYPYNAPPHPSSDYGGSIPPQAGPMPLNRRYSMHRSGELPPPRDYASMESPQQGGMPPMAGGPPGPMNRRSSQRGGQQPPYMHQDYHQRSISVPPGSYEAGAPVQDGRRRTPAYAPPVPRGYRPHPQYLYR
ncbi:hypothetical protein BJ508DRAFT_124282 [Ascobolus immersus RN42]|uniref:Uncharacterized protein n=1 Tax=Ascobolus immersus RN42 TaxID=1160509 RepID=A0A3N4I458_ASCIM|nr:hypothetical protein BJ508DRAFT_124282 [Ascobolus immersus RN42]